MNKNVNVNKINYKNRTLKIITRYSFKKTKPQRKRRLDKLKLHRFINNHTLTESYSLKKMEVSF